LLHQFGNGFGKKEGVIWHQIRNC